MNLKKITENEMDLITSNIKLMSLEKILFFNALEELFKNIIYKTKEECYLNAFKKNTRDEAIQSVLNTKIKISNKEIKHFIHVNTINQNLFFLTKQQMYNKLLKSIEKVISETKNKCKEEILKQSEFFKYTNKYAIKLLKIYE